MGLVTPPIHFGMVILYVWNSQPRSQSSKALFLVFSGRLWTSAMFVLKCYAINAIRCLHHLFYETLDLPSGKGVLSVDAARYPQEQREATRLRKEVVIVHRRSVEPV